jgi:Fe-Mn family superoxide dismutase
MPHELPDLPYDYSALEPFLSEEILHIHHDKHHAGYVKALNEAERKVRAAQMAGDFADVQALCAALAFNYSGHVLHSLLWTNMSPEGGVEPEGELVELIDRDFGDLGTLRKQFIAAANAVQGSGWGVLAWQPLGRQLVVLQAEKHQNLAQWGATPLLVLDVWEHAYYLQYENRRTEYTARFFDVIDWSDVADRLEAAMELSPIRTQATVL